ncbi:MAG: hypothetical protein H6627_02320 [Calditrichae bacterium]|nr:hypothetical protein [Calditrichia bacterium]
MRIVTRGDFDSLISSVLLNTTHEIEDVLIVHPVNILENRIDISENDILANVPYHPDCGYWFDHHVNEVKMAEKTNFKGHFSIAPSCSRVIYNYYNNTDNIERFATVVNVADKIDTAQFSIEDIKNPRGWFIIDRTLHAFDSKGRLGNYREYFIKLIHWISNYSLSEILLADDVQQRIEHVRSEHKLFVQALGECSYIDNNIIITDSRKMRYFPNGNRYLIYTLYPQQNVSVSIFNRRDTDYSVIFVGHNIFNRTCQTDVNELLKKFQGSGRTTAGTCVVPQNKADDFLHKIIDALREPKE